MYDFPEEKTRMKGAPCFMGEKNRPVLGLAINVISGKAYAEKTTLAIFAKEMGLGTLDTATSSINGQRFLIVVDDEGLLKERQIASAVRLGKKPSDNPTVALVGPLLVLSEDGSGLTDDEVMTVMMSVGSYVRDDGTRQAALIVD